MTTGVHMLCIHLPYYILGHCVGEGVPFPSSLHERNSIFGGNVVSMDVRLSAMNFAIMIAGWVLSIIPASEVHLFVFQSLHLDSFIFIVASGMVKEGRPTFFQNLLAVLDTVQNNANLFSNVTDRFGWRVLFMALGESPPH